MDFSSIKISFIKEGFRFFLVRLISVVNNLCFMNRRNLDRTSHYDKAQESSSISLFDKQSFSIYDLKKQRNVSETMKGAYSYHTLRFLADRDRIFKENFAT